MYSIISNWGIYIYSLIAFAVLFITGCAGTLTDVSNEVKEERQKIKQRVGQLYDRYEAAREVYGGLREAIKERWDEVPEELQDELARFDAKAVEFNTQVEALKQDLEQADKNIQDLEKMAKDADKRWTELIDTIKNISKLALRLS